MKIIRHKFNAIKTEVDDIKFPSKLEASYYKFLKLCQKSGQVLFFLRQVPFHLPGNTKYLADFMVFYADGTVQVVEVKGYDNPVGKIKRQQVEELYNINIELIRKV